MTYCSISFGNKTLMERECVNCGRISKSGNFLVHDIIGGLTWWCTKCEFEILYPISLRANAFKIYGEGFLDSYKTVYSS